jgi:hypothetical protein
MVFLLALGKYKIKHKLAILSNFQQKIMLSRPIKYVCMLYAAVPLKKIFCFTEISMFINI